MGSLTPPSQLPVVDLSKETLKPGTSSWFSACNNVRNALEEFGAFVAISNKVSLELHDAVFSTLEELFQLPTETKMKNIPNKPWDGYVGQEPNLPLYESVAIDDATSFEATQKFTNLLWPAGNHRFCETVLSYSKQASEIEQMVTRMVFESYGLEKDYESHNAAITYLTRLVKFTVPKTNQTKQGLGTHTDKSFITVVHQNHVKGLQIKSKDGEWIGYDPSPSSFVIIAGDAFLAWSNGRIRAPNHQVIMSETEERYTVQVFSFSNKLIEVPEELVDDEHPLRYKPFDNFGLLNFCYEVDPRMLSDALTAYCGI